MIIERRRELEFNTEARESGRNIRDRRSAGYLQSGRASTTVRTSCTSTSPQREKVKEREKENVKPCLEKCCLHAMLASGMRDFVGITESPEIPALPSCRILYLGLKEIL